MDGGARQATVHGVAKRVRQNLATEQQSSFLLEIVIQPVSFFLSAAASAKSLQLCPTLCDPIYGRLPSSHIPGILQARTLEWVAISYSNT